MDVGPVLDNLLTAPVLFFMLGAFAACVRSDLEIPNPVPKLLSIYLLFAIGFHGGHELAKSQITGQTAIVLAVCVAMSLAVPVWSFFILRLRLDVSNAAAIAATYGSISAVTFITATSFLSQQQIEYGGYMVAAMALMESPAIVVAILLARKFDRERDGNGQVIPIDWGHMLRDAFLNGAVVLLLGSLLIGRVTGDDGWASVKPFVHDPFKGVLCLFLLDLGLVAGRRMGELRSCGAFLLSFALVAPLAHGMMGVGIGLLLNLSTGDSLLLAVLFGSASYIAVPAAIRIALPRSNPGLFVPMALAITFPFNVVIGIPLYLAVIRALGS